MYNWFAVNDPRGLAPVGYHIPSESEWTELTDYLGGENNAGLKMKSTTGWKDGGNGDNSSGFNGLPGGDRNFGGIFGFIGVWGSWWSSMESDMSDAFIRQLTKDAFGVIRSDSYGKDFGFSVRCIKD